MKEGMRSQVPKEYNIEEKSQNTHTSMVYETGQYTIRVLFPPGGETQFAGLLRYLEALIRNMRGEESQSQVRT